MTETDLMFVGCVLSISLLSLLSYLSIGEHNADISFVYPQHHNIPQL